MEIKLNNDMVNKNNLIHSKNPQTEMFCSIIIDDGTRAYKIQIYNVVNNPQEKVLDHINEEFNIVDIVAHTLIIVNEKTGKKLKQYALY